MLLVSVACLQSCYKDNSDLASTFIPDVKYSNVEPSYTVLARIDTLKIKPKFAIGYKDEDYTYTWLMYSKNHVQESQTLAKADTLSQSKDVDYLITQRPGNYWLTFNIKHKETGVTKITRYEVTISTPTMSGWYILKDENNETDFDFYGAKGIYVHNWIAFYNGGKSLPGKSIKAVYIPAMKTKLNSVDLFSALGVVTDQDAGIYRLENGLVQYTYDNMFFTKPAVRKPQNMVVPMAGTVVLVNDNNPYYLTKGALFANLNPSNYRVSPTVSITAIDIYFDNLSKSVITYQPPGLTDFKDNAKTVKNTESNLVWMEGYVYPRNATSILLRHNVTGDGRLIKLNSTYTAYYSATEPFVILDKVVEKNHPLLNADLLAGNFDNDILYHVKDGKLYATNYATLEPELMNTFPAGENVTLVQHIKYPVPGPNVVNKINYLAVATQANGRYKVWLYEINSLGRIIPKSKPDFEGTGRVSNITYFENGEGSRTF